MKPIFYSDDIQIPAYIAQLIIFIRGATEAQIYFVWPLGCDLDMTVVLLPIVRSY